MYCCNVVLCNVYNVYRKQEPSLTIRNMSHTLTHPDIRMQQGAQGYILPSGAFKDVCPTDTADAGLISGGIWRKHHCFLCAYKILAELLCFVSGCKRPKPSGILLS